MSGTGVAEIPENQIDIETMEIHPNQVEEIQTEETELLVKDETKKKKRKEGTGTIFSAIINTLNAIIGGALLSLPFAFKQSGLIIGLLLVICCALFSLYTMVLLSLSADKTGVYNFERLGYLTYGRLGAAFSQLSLFGCLFGTLCAYFVIIADFVTPLVNTWAGVDISRVIIMTIAIVILLPLTLLQNINALSYTSIIALGSVLYVVCMITTKGILKVIQSGIPDDILLFNPSVDILHSFSIIVFSFSVQFNVLPIQKELYNPSPVRMGITSAFSTFVSSAIYLIVGIFGYFTFASAVSGNILTNYEDTEVTVQIGRIALTFTILFSYPIVSFPLKIVLSNALFKNVCPGFANTHSIVINMAITCGIIFSTFLVAVFVPDVSLIFGLLGGLTLSFVCFVIPSMVYLKLNGSRWCSIHSILPIFMSIFGIFVAITTLGYETKKLVDMIISVVQKPK